MCVRPVPTWRTTTTGAIDRLAVETAACDAAGPHCGPVACRGRARPGLSQGPRVNPNVGGRHSGGIFVAKGACDGQGPRCVSLWPPVPRVEPSHPCPLGTTRAEKRDASPDPGVRYPRRPAAGIPAAVGRRACVRLLLRTAGNPAARAATAVHEQRLPRPRAADRTQRIGSGPARLVRAVRDLERSARSAPCHAHRRQQRGLRRVLRGR
jgi:hypothetical protein